VVLESTFLSNLDPYTTVFNFFFLIGHCSIKVGKEKSLYPVAFLWPTYLISSGIQFICNPCDAPFYLSAMLRSVAFSLEQKSKH
jgi:hypothetical protein